MFPILHQGNVSLFQKENYWRCDFVRILVDHFLNLAKNTEGEENKDENEQIRWVHCSRTYNICFNYYDGWRMTSGVFSINGGYDDDDEDDDEDEDDDDEDDDDAGDDWRWRWGWWLAKAFVEWSSQRQWCRGL